MMDMHSHASLVVTRTVQGEDLTTPSAFETMQ
jgi:hypothetical protein